MTLSPAKPTVAVTFFFGEKGGGEGGGGGGLAVWLTLYRVISSYLWIILLIFGWSVLGQQTK